MKKLFFTVIITVIAVASLSAQKVGVKAGVNFANMNGSYMDLLLIEGDVETSGRTGFHLGAITEFELSDKINLQAEVLYSTQGFEGFEYNNITHEFTQQMDYLTIPIMLEYKITDELSLQAGPQIAFLASSKYDWGFDVNTVSGDANFEAEANKELENQSNNMDFGLNFGAEYTMESGLFFNARYSLGLGNVFKYNANEHDIELKNADLKNSVIQLSIGYSFDLSN